MSAARMLPRSCSRPGSAWRAVDYLGPLWTIWGIGTHRRRAPLGQDDLYVRAPQVGRWTLAVNFAGKPAQRPAIEPGPPVLPQRVGGPTAAVQGQHQLPDRALVERMLGDARGQVRHQGRVVPPGATARR